MNRDRDGVDLERSSRSVFVGNIPYEATEERLKDLFSEVGPVVSFRLVFDRETGKPKGYGFAEYQDMETAMSAMRNLNGRELLGRSLRVDHATSEKNRMMDELGPIGPFRPPQENRHGNPVASQDAPEAISKAVASLPPEQMFELMKQMKQCIQNNPVEARNMLLQNPQLAYALLQAQVVMRIVDPEIAMKMLHRQNPVPNIVPSGEPFDRPPNGDHPPFMERRRIIDENMDLGPPPRRREVSPGINDRRGPPLRGDDRLARGDMLGLGPRDGPMERGRMRMGGRLSPEPPFGRGPFGRPEMREDRFLERGASMDGIPGLGRDVGPPIMEHGFGGPPGPANRGGPPFRDGPAPGMHEQRGLPPDGPMEHGPPLDRSGGDPRRGGPRPGNEPPPVAVPPNDGANPDQEKAALIMQVLQLTPEQIAMLPEEQRKSILILKEQITGSAGR